MVSWRSADEKRKDGTAEDYGRARVGAIDTVRDVLGVKSVNTIGYCVAGTMLAITLAWLTSRGQAQKVDSATYFTAPVDFEVARDLKTFVDDDHLALVTALPQGTGYFAGRGMTLTCHSMREPDLI